MSGTHYDVLGVTADAPDAVIRAAFRARMRTAHPDAGGDPATAARLTEAFDVLSDLDRRAAYDAQLRSASASEPSAEPRAAWHEPAEPAEQEVPHAVWGSVPPPKPWYWSRLASLLFGFAVVGFACCFALAQVTAVGIQTAVYPVIAGFAVSVASIWLRPRTAAIIAGILGVGVILQNAVPVAGVLTIVLVAWMLILRWREQRAWDAHTADVVRTTSETFALPVEFVRRVEPLGSQTTLAQLEVVGSGVIHSTQLWGTVVPGVVIVRDDMTVLCAAQAAPFGYR